MNDNMDNNKIQLELSKDEEFVCCLQLTFFTSGVDFKKFKPEVMTKIFYDLVFFRHIDTKNIKIFINYCYSMAIVEINDAIEGRTDKRPNRDDVINDILCLQELALKIERKVLKDE